MVLKGVPTRILSLLLQALLWTASKVDQLRANLARTRAYIKDASTRESAILAELKKFGEGDPQVTADSQAIACSPLSQQTCEHQAQNMIVEEALKDERRRRESAEQLIRDIEKECREPFVVPALLQAFVDISQLAASDGAENHTLVRSS
ncbi:hypothetical protein SERLADRAFT_401406 [Serpula lacrymans var. lacrymans S7.9]|uniref:Uncharacterized protein n=2 Tax=Serpula lacrymans var. lacrymans TaxID=341189 RepID=F8P9Y5_SERL9|nr:uncharacterized protein SERLADRAFT_401406 [Serpula lacrymans var. lacrymans S7.9]EGO19983.1 hypothetical protein SERLADRAFT_401406 [Serpula lacrymans var. lacrymans S7.9]